MLLLLVLGILEVLVVLVVLRELVVFVGGIFERVKSPNFFLRKGLAPGRILYCKIPLVFHNGPTSNHRTGPILRWAQLQSDTSWFTALPEAALYTTTFYRDFQALKGEAELPVIGWDKSKGMSQS